MPSLGSFAEGNLPHDPVPSSAKCEINQRCGTLMFLQILWNHNRQIIGSLLKISTAHDLRLNLKTYENIIKIITCNLLQLDYFRAIWWIVIGILYSCIRVFFNRQIQFHKICHFMCEKIKRINDRIKYRINISSYFKYEFFYI